MRCAALGRWLSVSLALAIAWIAPGAAQVNAAPGESARADRDDDDRPRPKKRKKKRKKKRARRGGKKASGAKKRRGKRAVAQPKVRLLASTAPMFKVGGVAALRHKDAEEDGAVVTKPGAGKDLEEKSGEEEDFEEKGEEEDFAEEEDEAAGDEAAGDEAEGEDAGGGDKVAAAATADDAGGVDEAFDFGEDAASIAVEAAPERILPVSAGGFARTTTGMWLEEDQRRQTRVSQARQSLDLWASYKPSKRLRLFASGHAEYDAAYQVDRASYDDPTLDSYEYLVEPREGYAAGTADMLELTVGRQIVVWGEGLILSPMDLFNPRDLRELGTTDLDDARLPVLATRASAFLGNSRLEAAVVHESWFGHRAPPYGFWSPLPEAFPILLIKTVYWDEKQERFSPDLQQYFGRWSYKGAGFDVALYGAYALDQQGVVLVPEIDLESEEDVILTLDHRRYTAAGMSGAVPLGQFILKSEVGVQKDRWFNYDESMDGVPMIGVDKADYLVAMGGVQYWKERVQLDAEVAKGTIVRGRSDGALAYDDVVAALRARYNLERWPIGFEAAGLLSGKTLENGWLARGEVIYKVREALKASVGYVTYNAGREFGIVTGLGTNDRLYAKLRWDFTLF